MKVKNNTPSENTVLKLMIPAVFCTLLWGTAFPAIKSGYGFFQIGSADVGSKLLFAGARFFIAGIIVLLIMVCGRSDKIRIIPGRSDILPVLSLGFFQTFLQYLLLYLGISAVSGTKSALYTSVAAFATVLVSPLFFKGDYISMKKTAGCIVGVSGILFMTFNDGGLGGFTFSGDGLVLLSNLSGAAGNLVSKKVTSGERTPSFAAAWQLISGGTGLIITGLAFGGDLTRGSVTGWLVLIYLAVMAGVAFMIWTDLLKKNTVSRVAVYNLLIPVFGTMWSGIFLGENILTPVNLIALILVCGGIFLVNYSPAKSLHS